MGSGTEVATGGSVEAWAGVGAGSDAGVGVAAGSGGGTDGVAVRVVVVVEAGSLGDASFTGGSVL